MAPRRRGYRSRRLQAFQDDPKLLIIRPAPPATGLNDLKPINLSTVLMAVHKYCYTALNLTNKVAAPGGLPRIGFMFDPTDPIGAIFLKSIQKAAGTLNIECISLEVRDSDGFDAAFASGARRGMGALIIPPLPLFNTNRARIVERAAKAALPTIYGLREFVAAGGLCSYGANLSDVWRRSAYFVDKIFKGTRPGEIPIEQPTTFDLVLNTKTATAMGLIFPATLLARADEVIE